MSQSEGKSAKKLKHSVKRAWKLNEHPNTKDTVIFLISGHFVARNDEIYGRVQVTDGDYGIL